MKLQCLREVIHSGRGSYPVYIGFCSAEDLSKVAVAPAFSDTTANATIANNVLTPPVAEWQRPLISGSIDAITSTFDDAGRLMPNSVLLAKNPDWKKGVIPKQQTVNGVTPTSVWEIELAPPGKGQVCPLWILDGQHRIHGMKSSLQKSNPIPFVLLLNEDAKTYAVSRLAEIFAQVTTTAASLDQLHNEWMSYAFQLGKYSSLASEHAANQRAMETTALMCKIPDLDKNKTANPFRDQIKFNPKNAPASFPNGFAYDCVDMQKLLYRAYFSATPLTKVDRLSPKDLARQIGFAYIALRDSVEAPHDQTVFFGDREHAQRIMQDAFIVGVCTRLLQDPNPIDWPELLQSLRFNTSNWNFKPWVVSVSGGDQTTSKKIAEKVFRSHFRTGTLTGQADIVDILRGDNAKFNVEVEVVKENGRTDKQHAAAGRTLTQGSKLSVSYKMGAKRRVRIPAVTVADNIGAITAIDDGASTAANRIILKKIKEKRGLTLDPADSSYSSPLSIKFLVQLYGGIKIESDLNVDWK